MISPIITPLLGRAKIIISLSFLYFFKAKPSREAASSLFLKREDSFIFFLILV